MESANSGYIAILEKLISYNSESSLSNLNLIEFIEAFLSKRGFTCHTQISECGKKANLVAKIGPIGQRAIILSGHTDVVPVKDQKWTDDPFCTTLRDGKVYGRGSSDMKGFIATVLDSVDKFQLDKLIIPLVLVFTYDEEVGCCGAKALLKQIDNWVEEPPLACIVGEPTLMNVVNAHKGMTLFNTKVKGTPGHSSLLENKVNAIEYGAKIINFLSSFVSNASKETGSLLEKDEMTVNVGEVGGGTSVNIVAEYCNIHWESRYFYNDSKKHLLNELESYSQFLMDRENRRLGFNALNISTEHYSELPPLTSNFSDSFCKVVNTILGNNTCHRVNYCTEAGLFQSQWEIPTIICGPGSIEQAHKGDEFVEIEQLETSKEFIDSLLDYCCLHSELSLRG